MIRHTLKILQHFKSLSDHFRTLCIMGLKKKNLLRTCRLNELRYKNFVGPNKHLEDNVYDR